MFHREKGPTGAGEPGGFTLPAVKAVFNKKRIPERVRIAVKPESE